jgi:hypothetical protein
VPLGPSTLVLNGTPTHQRFGHVLLEQNARDRRYDPLERATEQKASHIKELCQESLEPRFCPVSGNR